MPAAVVYLDTSAFLKLAVEEDESEAMNAWVDGLGGSDSVLTSSVLLANEARRATFRVDGLNRDDVEEQLTFVNLVSISDSVLDAAGRFPEHYLRTLDAVHLAQAIELRAATLATYDGRLAAGARAHGIQVVSPSGPTPR